ncbi:MAG: hypothetical protein ABIB71_08490 [Candidatus Woesearchaeota archaeon]
MAKKKAKRKPVYFNNPKVNEAYLKVIEINKMANPFKGMTTIEILKEIRKRQD